MHVIHSGKKIPTMLLQLLHFTNFGPIEERSHGKNSKRDTIALIWLCNMSDQLTPVWSLLALHDMRWAPACLHLCPENFSVFLAQASFTIICETTPLPCVCDSVPITLMSSLQCKLHWTPRPREMGEPIGRPLPVCAPRNPPNTYLPTKYVPSMHLETQITHLIVT